MAGLVSDGELSEAIKKKENQASLLKLLREKKKVSRMQLSRLAQLSTYQVEGLEGKGTQSLLDKFFSCTHALGYKTSDVLKVMEFSHRRAGTDILKGSLGKPLSETNFCDGAKISTYLNSKGNFLGLLQLGVSKNIAMRQVHSGDIVFGVVREGTLVIDHLINQTVHKKDQFFVLPGSVPVRFLNGDSFIQVSTLILSIAYPA